MYRNIKISNKKYKNKNIIISPVKSYDEYVIKSRYFVPVWSRNYVPLFY